jgi:hypothetical protein
MKVFISWSREPSRTVASALRDWIPDVIQAIEPWMSDTDLEAGAKWSDRIQRELNETKFGIVCVTPENMQSGWLLFEAGALAKTIADAYVCPYLIGLEFASLRGPLVQFQAKRAIKEETRDLIHSLNQALGPESVDSARLDRSFDLSWPRLEAVLLLPEQKAAKSVRRATDDMIEEVLLLVRDLDSQSRSRRASSAEVTSIADLLSWDAPWRTRTDILRHQLTMIAISDRKKLTGLYNMLRDILAQTSRAEGETVEEPGGGE